MTANSSNDYPNYLQWGRDTYVTNINLALAICIQCIVLAKCIVNTSYYSARVLFHYRVSLCLTETYQHSCTVFVLPVVSNAIKN
jgi:hypothetical protein